MWNPCFSKAKPWECQYLCGSLWYVNGTTTPSNMFQCKTRVHVFWVAFLHESHSFWVDHALTHLYYWLTQSLSAWVLTLHSIHTKGMSYTHTLSWVICLLWRCWQEYSGAFEKQSTFKNLWWEGLHYLNMSQLWVFLNYYFSFFYGEKVLLMLHVGVLSSQVAFLRTECPLKWCTVPKGILETAARLFPYQKETIIKGKPMITSPWEKVTTTTTLPWKI